MAIRDKSTGLIYVVYDGVVSSSVFNSQVVGFLSEIPRHHTMPVWLVGFENLKIYLTRQRRIRLKKRLLENTLGIRASLLPRIPGHWGLTINAFLFRWLFLLKQRHHPLTDIICHSRGGKSTVLCTRLKRIHPGVRIIYDARGLEAEEYRYHIVETRKKPVLPRRKQRVYDRLQTFEQVAIRRADHVLCVGSSMKRYFHETYDPPPQHMTVNPCGADPRFFRYDPDTRDKMRRSLDLEDRLVLVYSGSTHVFQHPDIVVRFFHAVLQENPDAYLMVLTFDRHPFARIFRDTLLPEDSCGIFTLAYHQIPAYLNTADVGLLLRRKHLINRVACPVKFVEYHSCGLFMALTDHIGDVSDIAKQEDAGLILNDLSDTEFKRAADLLRRDRSRVLDPQRRRTRAALALRRYGWPFLVPRVLEAYDPIPGKQTDTGR